MANFKLLWDQKTDGVTLSGGSWEADLPLTNVQDRLLQKTARSTDASISSTKFDIDLLKSTSVQSLILVNHNLDEDALIRIKLSDDATFTTSDYDSGWVNVYKSVFSVDSVEWENDNFWFGRLASGDLAGYSLNYIHLLDVPYSNRYIRVEIDDTANSDGYVDIGRLWVTPVFEFDFNAIYGATISWNDPTVVSTAIGGSTFFDDRAKKRNYRFSTDMMSVTESMESIFEIQRSKGISGEIFILPDSDDSINIFRTSFLGRMTKLAGITNHFFKRNKSDFSIEELL